MTTQQAMANADERQSIFERHLADVASKPSSMLSQSLVSMTDIRDRHMKRRLEIEAEHRTNLDMLRRQFDQSKEIINRSILELEKQLGTLRDQWARMSDEEQRALREAEETWRDQDDAQAKLIEAENLFIDNLK